MCGCVFVYIVLTKPHALANPNNSFMMEKGPTIELHPSCVNPSGSKMGAYALRKSVCSPDNTSGRLGKSVLFGLRVGFFRPVCSTFSMNVVFVNKMFGATLATIILIQMEFHYIYSLGDPASSEKRVNQASLSYS